MFPGETFTDNISTNLKGTITESDSTPIISIYRNGLLENTVTVSVTPDGVIPGLYVYSFNVPSSWNEGDRISILLSWSKNSNTYLHRKFIDTIKLPILTVNTCLEAIKDILDFWGYTPGIIANIDEQNGTITLSDGRQIQISVDITGIKII